MARCPVCKTQTQLIKYENVPIQSCGTCGGHWLTNAKLDAILNRREVVMPPVVQQKMMDIADAADSKQTLWCMTCGAEMVKEQFKYWPEILLDRCPKCNGLWLDQGELEKCQIYWEYAQDHPEQWEGREIVERQALLDAEWARRKAQLRERADRATDRARGFGRLGMLRGLFGL
ncbi:MAG: hypothetical protein D6744_12390 [Planctomycetota bacterium]|nr:MAG: hypothetical protein D6744_12390 [Planctomycetota bacterium]